MSSVVSRQPAGTAELRARAARYNSSLELERHLATGGTLAQWYAQAAAPPSQTELERKQALLARIIRLMPEGLDADEQAAYIALAQSRAGL